MTKEPSLPQGMNYVTISKTYNISLTCDVNVWKKNDSGDMEINYLLPMDNVCCDKINDKSVTEEEE